MSERDQLTRGIELMTSRLEAKRSSPFTHQSPSNLTPPQTGLYARQLYLTEQETACLSGMADDCTVGLVASSSSFDSFYDQYYWLVYNCQSNQFSLIIAFIIGQLELFIYVQFHNICQSVWYLNPEAQNCSVSWRVRAGVGHLGR